MSILRLLLLLVFLPTATLAQSWPPADDLYVNDWAKVLPDAAKTRIGDALRLTKESAGVHVVLVTMRAGETPGATNRGIEAYATGLFNAWGIGDRQRNDGILILVWPDRRTLRIELGRGYGRAWDKVAGQVIETAFLPQFRAGNMAAGIESGVQATISQIAWPFSRKAAPPALIDWGSVRPVLGVFGVLALWLGGRGALGALAARRTCPKCGHSQAPMRSWRKPLNPFARGYVALSEFRCSRCGHHWQDRDEVWQNNPSDDLSSSGSSGGFGGGRSSGGGATGRW